MKLDVMNTQTGGEGETIQASNPTQETPQQYDVKVSPVQSSSEPPPSEPASPIIQQPIVGNAPMPEPPAVPEVVGNKPVSEDVGFMDWFSGDTIDSISNIELEEDAVDEEKVEPFIVNTSDDFAVAQDEEDEFNQSELLKQFEDTDDDDPLKAEMTVKETSLSKGNSAPIMNLPTLPLGIDSKKMQEIRTKYQGYDIQTDAFGIKAVKKGDDLSKPAAKPKGTTTPPIKTYTVPGSVNKYAIIDNTWKTQPKGSTDWITIDEPIRIQRLNKYLNKNVPTGKEKDMVGQSGDILKSQGMMPSTEKVKGVKQDENGDWVVNSSTPYQSLFTGGKPFGQTMAVNSRSYYEEEKVGLKNQRSIELQAAKTDAQRKQVNDKFDRLEAQIQDKQKGEEAWVQANNNAVAKEISKPVEQREKKVKQTIDVVKALNLNVDPSNLGLLDSQIKGADYVPSIIERAQEVEKEQENDFTLAKAQTFANKDLNTWRKVYGQHLTDSQFNEFVNAQKKTQELLKEGGDDISALGVERLNKIMDLTAQRLNTTIEVNTEINRAAQEGKTVSEYQLDQKKLFASQINAEIGDQSFIGRTKNLFNSSVKIHDFMLSEMKDGNIVQDGDGVYRVADGVSKEKANYINQKLATYMAEYKNIKETEYNTLQDDIAAMRSKRKTIELSIAAVKNNMSKLTPGTPEYEEAKAKIQKAQNSIKKLDSDIDNLKNGNRAFFLTEPKELAKSLSPYAKDSDIYAIFSSLDQDLSPKQKFDIGYRKLWQENQKLAQQYGIDTSRLDQIGQSFRSMLDWESMGISLSAAEKKYFANKKMLYTLAPLYLNNENGITQESAGFFESFWNTFNQTLVGTTAAGSGYINQTAIVNENLNYLREKGYTDEDLAHPINMKDLEQRKNVSWVSGEGLGEIMAPTAAIILELVASKKLSTELLGMGEKVAGLVSKVDSTGKVLQYTDKVAKTLKTFDTALQSTKTGRYLKESVEQGVEMEVAGEVFGSGEEELNFTSGFLGSLAGQGLVSLFSKIPAGKLTPIVQSIFGNNTDKALAVFQKSGAVLARGGGEVSEEFTQELVSIYNSTLDERGFWQEVENRFGSFDDVMKFVTSSFLMGGAFGMRNSGTASEIYEDMPAEERAKVDAVVSSAREDIETAQSKTEEVAQTAIDEVQIEQDIDNDFKTETNDSENIEGQPSVVGEGETAVETKPDTQTSVTQAPTSGVLETQPKKIIGIKPTVNDGEFYLDESTGDTNKYKINEFTGRVQYLDETNGLWSNIGKGMAEDGVLRTAEKKGFINANAISDTQSKMRTGAPSATGKDDILESMKVPEVEAATEKDMFDEAKSIKRMNTVKRKDAIKEFDAKHGKGSYERAEKINTNFVKIIKSMESNGLIEKKC